jgi:hypothetical protein
LEAVIETSVPQPQFALIPQITFWDNQVIAGKIFSSFQKNSENLLHSPNKEESDTSNIGCNIHI